MSNCDFETSKNHITSIIVAILNKGDIVLVNNQLY